MVGAIRAGSWLDVSRLEAKLPQSPAMLHFTTAGGGFGADFPLLWGRRLWMLGTPDRDRSLADVTKSPQTIERHSAPLPQHLLIKHGDFPLDLMKDYQFEVTNEPGQHPRLILNAADVAALRKNADAEALRQKIKKQQLTTTPLYDHTMSASIEAYLVTGDAALGKYLSDLAAARVQAVVDTYFNQVRLATPGFAPHMRQGTAVSLLLADAVMDGGHIAPKCAAASRRRRRLSATR